MKVTRVLGSLLLLGMTATASFAGTVDLNWTPCAPSGFNTNTAGGGPIHAYASLTNQSVVSQSYEIKIRGGSPGGPIADAWRFDPTGCEGTPFWGISVLPPAAVSKTCPALMGNVPNIQVKDYSYITTTGQVQIILANLYPNNGLGNPNSGNPATKYFMADYLFDLTFAVAGPSDPVAGTCGGVLNPVCLAIYQTDFIDLTGAQVDYTVGQGFLTVNDANNLSHCPGSVPTVPKTWGQVKGQYR